MSASMTAVTLPFACDAVAKSAHVIDLPTPPLPLTTAITRFISLIAWGCFLRLAPSREGQSSPHDAQSCEQFSAIQIFSFIH